jgi:hypothetical protein
MEASALPTQTSSTEGLDALAASLTSMLQSAASRAGHLTRKRARAAPWWNDKCALAAAEHRSMRRIYPLGYGNEARLVRKGLQRVVRDAERLFWQALVDKVSSNEDIFKITRWTKARSPFQPPPLQVNGTVYETMTEKATALRQATLERRASGDDIENPWVDVSPNQSLPFSSHVSSDEARKHIPWL